jgi:hypothetical protein
MTLRLKVGLLAVAAALCLTAAAPVMADASAVYKLNREGLRIALQFRGGHLSHLRVVARERCSDGTSPVREYVEEDLHRVAAKGHLLYEGGYNTEYGYTETRLSLHVVPGAVRGAFFDIDSEGYVCATGHPGKRTLRFAAPRVRG